MVEKDILRKSYSDKEYSLEHVLRIMFILFSDDPKTKILRLLAEFPSDKEYVSFRSLARKVGVSYNKLRLHLLQLERAGFIECTKITLADLSYIGKTDGDNSSNNKNNSKGYTYYRLKPEIRIIVRRVLLL
ncbi:MAG: winged helix-turn-helix transcriptional regulator [Sulfolobales archaeon]